MKEQEEREMKLRAAARKIINPYSLASLCDPDEEKVKLMVDFAKSEASKQYHSPTNEVNMLNNKIELLREDLEGVHLYLDDLKVPRSDKFNSTLSIVGRIKELNKL